MKTPEEIFDKALQDRGINRIGLQVFGVEIYEAGLDAIKQALTIPDVSGSAEADYWSNRCKFCLLYTSPSPRDRQKSRMPSSA